MNPVFISPQSTALHSPSSITVDTFIPLQTLPKFKTLAKLYQAPSINPTAFPQGSITVATFIPSPTSEV